MTTPDTEVVRPHSRSPHTPDALGYLLAVGVSIAVTWLELVVLTLLSDGPSDDTLALLVYGWMPIAVFAVPTASVGVLAVHLACRHVRAQWVHVLAAGLAGVVAGFVVASLLTGGIDLPWAWVLGAIVGLATAAGRAAVIPMVPRGPA